MDTQRFINALRELEERGELEPMIGLFTDDAAIWNPELPEAVTGTEGARSFWESYRDTFADVRSEFHAVIEHQPTAALEWRTTGHLRRTNQPVDYRGVSVLEWSNGQIKRFFAYFDPRALRSRTVETP